MSAVPEPPPPVDVIVEKIESPPLTATPPGTPPEPPAPTVIGYPPLERVKPAGAANGSPGYEVRIPPPPPPPSWPAPELPPPPITR